jgi:hypothetical protein
MTALREIVALGEEQRALRRELQDLPNSTRGGRLARDNQRPTLGRDDGDA